MIARQVGFPLTRQEAAPGQPSACLPGVGRFLAVLAAGCHGGMIAELGTGAGIGAAWLASSGVRDAAGFAALAGLLKPGGRIVMDDVTPVRALPAGSRLLASDTKRELFAGEQRLTWTEVVVPDLANSLLVGTRRAA